MTTIEPLTFYLISSIVDAWRRQPPPMANFASLENAGAILRSNTAPSHFPVNIKNYIAQADDWHVGIAVDERHFQSTKASVAKIKDQFFDWLHKNEFCSVTLEREWSRDVSVFHAMRPAGARDLLVDYNGCIIKAPTISSKPGDMSALVKAQEGIIALLWKPWET